MKFHSDPNDSSLRITAYDAGSVAVGERKLTSDFIITPQTILADLPRLSVQSLSWDVLSALHDLELDVLLVGTGSQQQFPAGEFYTQLSGRRIGLEVMTSAAACRTFNILAAEHRRVAALITFEHGHHS